MSSVGIRIALAICVGISTGCTYRAYVPEKVTTEGLLAIKKGMTYSQVEALIGPPLCVREFAGLKDAAGKVTNDYAGDCSRVQRFTPGLSVEP